MGTTPAPWAHRFTCSCSANQEIHLKAASLLRLEAYMTFWVSPNPVQRVTDPRGTGMADTLSPHLATIWLADLMWWTVIDVVPASKAPTISWNPSAGAVGGVTPWTRYKSAYQSLAATA